jgi:soluble lytic murein transglycosylase-like protein
MAFSAAVAARGVGSPYETLLATTSAQTGVPLALLKGIISQESAWNPGAVNAADPSYGLMQINIRAHPDVSSAQALDPAFAIPYGANYLASLIARDGLPAAISSYNAGRPITGNAAYVSAVLAYQAWFEANDPLSNPYGTAVDAAPPVDFASADPIPQTDSDGNLVGWYAANPDGTVTTWDANGENPVVTGAISGAGGLSVTTWLVIGAGALLFLGGLGASR